MNAKTITAPAAQSTALTTQAPPQNRPPDPTKVANPFQKSVDQRTVAGVVAIESERAIAEAQGKLVIAKRFPRDQFLAFERMRAACQRPGLAEVAFYQYPRGGQQVRGPSIRLAEELALAWGNIEYGMRELSNDAEAHLTEMQAFAWDLESNVLSSQQFTVRHIRDTQGGGKPLTDQRDIYEIGANMGARRMRARILAVLPADFVDVAVQLCTETATKGDGAALSDRSKKLISHFAKHGVTVAHLEQYIGHAIASLTEDDFVSLKGIATALKDGANPADYFSPPEVNAPAAAPQAAPSSQPAAAPAKAPEAKPATTAAPAAATTKEAPKPETKPAAAAPASSTAPASTTAAPAATDTKPEGEKGKKKPRALIVDVDPKTGEVIPKPATSNEAPKQEAAPAETTAAAPAAEGTAAPAADPAQPDASPIENKDDDLFA